MAFRFSNAAVIIAWTKIIQPSLKLTKGKDQCPIVFLSFILHPMQLFLLSHHFAHTHTHTKLQFIESALFAPLKFRASII